MTVPLEAVAKLRAFAVDPSDTHVAAWVATRIAEYLEHAAEGRTLDEALGLKPGRGEASWWRLEAMKARDAAIKRFAQPFADEPVAEQARRVLVAADRYRRGRWRFDQGGEGRYDDPQTQALYRLMTATRGRVPGERTVRDVLYGEIPDLIASGSLSNPTRGD